LHTHITLKYLAWFFQQLAVQTVTNGRCNLIMPFRCAGYRIDLPTHKLMPGRGRAFIIKILLDRPIVKIRQSGHALSFRPGFKTLGYIKMETRKRVGSSASAV